ncbi:phage integrase N-terminal SAM-like domain-containing protein [Desulfobacula sp.]|uniref:phage integrase N-terminal SAM-like domain-containing protein n=1 Tax=Desulfobacula sp. TaxID=2593537 RepID=UPI0025C1E7CF|nr:phage integrase N-terminal SAM-like domain-containing protein [Desulfobacula sp.]
MDCSIFEIFNLKKHAREMGKNEIEKFLSYLTVKRSVSAATQKQALNAIIFLYKEVLDINIDKNYFGRYSFPGR